MKLLDELAQDAAFDNAQLTTDILDLNGCVTFEQVDAALLSITGKLAFDNFLYRGRFQTGGTRFVEQIVSNHHPAWRRHYEDQFAQIDPAALHACTSLSPLVWCDDLYRSAAQQNFRKLARLHGIAEGVTFPVHSRNGDFAQLNLSLSRCGDDARRHVRATLTWGTLLATLTHEAMRRIVKDRSIVPAPALTRRELEVLKWIAEGKSNWEIARLVDISEHGVSHHVRNILLKFDVGSRHQAVAQAHVLGML